MDQRYTENDQRDSVEETSHHVDYLYPILDPPDEPATDSEYQIGRNETEEQLRKYWNLPRITPTIYMGENSEQVNLDEDNNPDETVYIVQEDHTDPKDVSAICAKGVDDEGAKIGCEMIGSTILSPEPQLGYKGAKYITSIMADYCFDDKFLAVTMREFFIYAIFYACLLFVTVYKNDCTVFEHNNTIKKALGIKMKQGNVTFWFHEITTQLQVWQFLNIWLNKRVLLDLNMYNKYRCGKESDEEPVLLASPRLTQVRVQATQCTVVNDSKCYGHWSKENEDTAAFGLKEKPGWVYTPDYSLDHIGKINRYYGGGYGAHLKCPEDFNRLYQSTPLLQEECLEGDPDLAGKPGNTAPGAWIDEQTRAIFLEYNTYSASTNFLTFVTLIFEIPPQGDNVWTTSHIWTYQLFRTKSVLDFMVLALEVFILMMLLFYTMERIKEFLYFRSKIFCSLWAILEVLLVLAGLTFFLLALVRARIIRKELSTYIDMVCRGDFFPTRDLLHIKKWLVAANMAFGIFIFLATVKLIKFLTVLESFAKIVFLAKKGLCSVFLLLIVFNVLIITFGAFGHLLFCEVSPPFRSLCSSIISSYAMLLGSLDYKTIIMPCSRYSSLIFIFLYYLTISIFGVNFLKAVAIQSYADSMCFYKANCVRRCRFGCSIPFIGRLKKMCSTPFPCPTTVPDAHGHQDKLQSQSSCGDPELMLSSNTCCGLNKDTCDPCCNVSCQQCQ